MISRRRSVSTWSTSSVPRRPQLLAPPVRHRQRTAHELLEGQLGRDVRLVVGELHVRPRGGELVELERERQRGRARLAMGLEQEVEPVVAIGVAVGHPDVGHDRRVLRVAAQLALAEDPRRQLLELEPHAPTPTAGIGEAARRGQRVVDVRAQPGVGGGVAPVDDALLDVAVEPREPRREHREGERRGVRRRQRVAEAEVRDVAAHAPVGARALAGHERADASRACAARAPGCRSRRGRGTGAGPSRGRGRARTSSAPPASETSSVRHAFQAVSRPRLS